MSVLQKIESEQVTREVDFRPGDTVKVHVRIKEGEKTRIQVFEGVVLGMRGSGSRASFTVRKVSYATGGRASRCIGGPRLPLGVFFVGLWSRGGHHARCC